MRRLVGAAIVLLITTGSAQAQRRMRFDSLGGFELFRRIVDEDGKAGITVGGSIGFTRAGNGAEEALAGVRYAARSGRTDYLSLDSRLTASPGGAGGAGGERDPLLEGTHRAIARVGNLKLDLQVDHSALGRSYSLRPDVSGAPYRDVSAGATFDLVFKSLREGAVVAPIEVRGRRVTYQDGHPGLSSIEISAGVGTRFDGRREYDEKKEAFGTVEMFNVTYIGTRVEAATSAVQPQARAAPAVTMADGGHRLHQFDFRLLNYDQMFFRDGSFGFTMFLRLGYGYLYDATTGEDGGAGIFRYGTQMGDDEVAGGLVFAVEPGTSDAGEIVSTWRIEMLLHSRKPKLGAWDLRFGWNCASPDDTDDLCGEGAVGRAALELEAYLELSREWQLGASYLGDYGPWRGTSEWRNEALAFLRWDVSR